MSGGPGFFFFHAMTTRSSYCLWASLLLVLPGCLATTQEIEDLRGDIVRLQTSLADQQKAQGEFQGALKENQNSLQGNQADLSAKMEELTVTLESLSSQLVETDNHMTSLATRIDDLDKNTSNRLDAVVKTVQGVKSIPAPSPSRFIKPGPTSWPNGGTIKLFRFFKVTWTNTGYRKGPPCPIFHRGMCMWPKKIGTRPWRLSMRLLPEYPKSGQVPTALLQKGATLEQMEKPRGHFCVRRVEKKVSPIVKKPKRAHERLKAFCAAIKTTSRPNAPRPLNPNPNPSPSPKKIPPSKAFCSMKIRHGFFFSFFAFR
jgi:hypothetical protein